MSEQELYTLLSNIQLSSTQSMNVAYDHFTDKVEPPFIIYRNTDTSMFFADNKSYYRENNYIVDLATEKKDLEIEAKVEQVFDNNCIPFTKMEDYIESERIFQIRYFI